MGWKIPITLMFNLTHLRQTHPVMLTSEYLRLHNISEDQEWSNGAWLRSTYHKHASVFEPNQERKPLLHVIENWWYDPAGVNRVDQIPQSMKARGGWDDDGGDFSQGQRGSWGTVPSTVTSRYLQQALPADRSFLHYYEARAVLEMKPPEQNGRAGEKRLDISTDEALEEVLRANGWEVLYTYGGA